MATSAVGSTTDLGAKGLGVEDFLKILLTQLTYQDPLKPMDNQEFMAQMAQFTTLEQTQQLNDKLDQVLTSQALSQSIGLLGRTVDAQGNAGVTTGTVSAIAMGDTGPSLTIKLSDGTVLSSISLSQISNIR
ncbi:MAG: flagellar hook capping FlgD N-terminal domain-containing protein [Rhodocyclaceae bacterium]